MKVTTKNLLDAISKDSVSEKTERLSQWIGLDLNYFLTGGFWIAASLFISSIGGIFLSALFARVWPTDVYGQFSFLVSALGFMSLTVLPGMGQAVAQASAEGKDGTYLAATKLLARWSVVGTIILISGSAYFYFRQNPNLALATFLSALAFPIGAITGLYNFFLSGKKRFKDMAVFTTIAQLSSIGATAFALVQFPTLAWVALFSAWSTSLVNVILTLGALKKAENRLVDYKLLNFGKHLSFSQMFPIAADYFDRFFVPLMLGFSNNAVYAFAILIPMQIHSLLKVFVTLAQPKISETNIENLRKDLIKKCMELEALIFVVVCAYILASPIIFDILYPAYKKEALLLSQLFSLSLLYFPANIISLVKIKQRATGELYITNAVNAGTSILLVLIMVYYFGLLGAVLARITSRFFQLAVQVYYFKKIA